MIKIVAKEAASEGYVGNLAGGECFLLDGEAYMMTQLRDGSEYRKVVRCSDGLTVNMLKWDRVTPIKTELKYWEE